LERFLVEKTSDTAGPAKDTPQQSVVINSFLMQPLGPLLHLVKIYQNRCLPPPL
jgi:hypothetical protein